MTTISPVFNAYSLPGIRPLTPQQRQQAQGVANYITTNPATNKPWAESTMMGLSIDGKAAMEKIYAAADSAAGSGPHGVEVFGNEYISISQHSTDNLLDTSKAAVTDPHNELGAIGWNPAAYDRQGNIDDIVKLFQDVIDKMKQDPTATSSISIGYEVEDGTLPATAANTADAQDFFDQVTQALKPDLQGQGLSVALTGSTLTISTSSAFSATLPTNASAGQGASNDSSGSAFDLSGLAKIDMETFVKAMAESFQLPRNPDGTLDTGIERVLSDAATRALGIGIP
jgi:hypothetical protein